MSRNGGTLSRAQISRVIRVYDSWIIRAYCRVRFLIIRQRFLDEIGQYLPERGRIVDIGSGFGLFALYYALRCPDLHIAGVDVDARRIAHARNAAAALGLTNVSFNLGDAARFTCDGPIDGAYMLDIVHHLPRADAARLLGEIAQNLKPSGRLVVKDVANRPYFKMFFTWVLDKLMSPSAPVDYWAPGDLAATLRASGLIVFRHDMVDVLPYPHVLFIAEKPTSPSAGVRT